MTLQFDVKVEGIESVRAYLKRFTYTASALGRIQVLVGSPVRYARYVEQGTRRMRARPHLLPAFQEVEPRIKGAIVAALDPPVGPQGILDVLLKLGDQVATLAKQKAPVRTGNLRDSYITTAGRRA